MSKRKKYPQLLRGERAALAARYPLTHEQREQQQAAFEADKLRPEIKEMLLTELQQLINGLSFDIEISRCQGSAMAAWLAEGKPLMMRMDLDAIDSDAYMAMDYLAIQQLANLCLGGRVNAKASDADSELTITESRIALRIFSRLLHGLEYLLRGNRSGGVAEVMKSPTLPETHTAVVYKIRMVLDGEVISWFIWLPVAMIIQPTLLASVEVDSQPVMAADAWQRYPVKGRAVLLEKQINVRQLQQLLGGQFMPLSLQDNANFRIGKQQMFTGKVAQEDGKLVFQVTEK